MQAALRLSTTWHRICSSGSVLLLGVATMVSMRRLLFSCTALVILAVSAVGCGKDSNPATPTASATATTSTLSGLLTDGFSGGILPGIGVRIMSGPNQGKDVKTDLTG